MRRTSDLLYVWGNDIGSIQPLKWLKRLKHLHIGNNNISNILPLINMKSLVDLRLNNNNISELRGLRNLTSLTKLHLQNNNITDVTALTKLVNLEELKLAGNDLEDEDFYPLVHLASVIDVDVDWSITFPDAGLAAKVREALGLASDADITLQDLQSLTSLTARVHQLRI